VLPYLLAVFVFLVGLYGIVSSRDLIHLTVCVSVCQSATYILLLAIGYREHGTAPVYGDIPTSRKVVDPVVQAMTLTDIVVAVAVSALLLALALRVFDRNSSLDPSHVVGQRG
jgi:multicomponent Na+:H+ antiporter subunit C